MMISVSFAFEADSIDEAKELVAKWTVTPGVTLTGLQGTEPGLVQPSTVLYGGSVGGAVFEAQKVPQMIPPPPVLPPVAEPKRPEPPEPK